MANIYNINIDQGSTHAFSVTYKDASGNPIDLTLYSASLQVRTSYTASSANIFLRSPSGIVFGGSVEFAKGNGTITVTTQGRVQYSKYFASSQEFPPNNLLLDFMNNIGMTIGNVSDEYVICATPITATVSIFASMSMREY